MYKLKLILALTIVGGLIAYIGDKIGMKVGKSRLSLGGLRPKYTSIIITTATGVLIALLSLGCLIAVSAQFRQAVFEMENLLAEKKELKSEVKKLVNRKDDLEGQVDNLTHNLSLFGRVYFQSMKKPIIYKQGDILVSGVIKGSKSQAEIREELIQLIKKTASKTQLSAVDYNQVELQQAVEVINKNQQTIVQLLAAQNVFRADELAVSFDLYQDYKVYKVGTEIVEFNLTSSNLETEINKLVAKLNQVGLQAGILPDKQGQVIDFNIIEFNPLINSLRQKKEAATIIVSTKQDVWRSDRLEDKLKFSVEEAGK